MPLRLFAGIAGLLFALAHGWLLALDATPDRPDVTRRTMQLATMPSERDGRPPEHENLAGAPNDGHAVCVDLSAAAPPDAACNLRTVGAGPAALEPVAADR